MTKEIKTISGWCEFYDRTGKGSWSDYAEVGSVVAEEVIDNFMNALPPRSLTFGYMQVGEVYNHIEDEHGKLRGLYMTFAKFDGEWKYCGYCFANETINRD